MSPPVPHPDPRLRGDATAGGIHALCELLRERLASGQDAGNNRLPDEFTLVRELGVSRTRLRAAFDILRAEGRLTRRPGHGTFAAAPRLSYQPGPGLGITSTLASQHVDATHELLSAATWSMDPLSASHFDVEPGAPLHVIERLTRLGSEPLSFTAYVVRGDVTPDMLDDDRLHAGLDMRAWLAASCLRPLSHYEATVEATAADSRIATHLACEVGAPLLRYNRRFISEAGELIAFGSATYRADRFVYQAARQPLSSPAPSDPSDWEITAP
ncbi:MAG TPA: GntR family transcriptional regulator [Kribbella sp.]|jgi:GntR family transcriptional regulator